ncbi:hypothetical protein MMC26_004359 [Xylographa opegraphella]|nr:hypothetical protein [Xylographa opegraphella]
MSTKFTPEFARMADYIFDPPSQTRDTAIVLVHGGWVGPDVFSLVKARLERAGYTVLTPSLPSSGHQPALTSFDDDVAAVRCAIKSLIDTGKQIVLVMHSYGAVPGCEALKGLSAGGKTKKLDDKDGKGSVIKLVFIAAMTIAMGASTYHPKNAGLPVPGFEHENDLVKVLDARTRFYNDLSDSDAAYWVSCVRVQSMFVFYSHLTYPAYKYFPSAYLFTLKDMAIPLKVQQRMVAAANISETSTIDAGHCPHISQPVAVERYIRKCAGEATSLL